MSDILLHAALAENQTLLRTFVKRTIDPTAILDVDAYSNANRCDMYKMNSWTAPISQCPNMVKSWQEFLTPLTTPRANGFKVCDTSGYYRCGADCNWTVPTGVTEVQFQLWGHGGGNSGQCCCGGTPWGPTGTYMVATINVVPGETFQLHAGCAYCCYASQTTPGYNQDVTYVCSCTNANGCFNIAAVGAVPEYYNWCYSAPTGMAWSTCGPITNDSCNPDSCSGWNFCWDTGADNVSIPHMFSKCEMWCICCNTRTKFCAYGLPAIYPAFVIGGDLHTGTYQISPPVFGFENCTCCLSAASVNYAIGGCCWQASVGYQQIPAVGGYGKYICGGYGGCNGDAGGMGMVCVSWNCA